MVHKKTPTFLSDPPAVVSQRTNYMLRNRNNLTIEKHSSETFKKSFVPSTTKLWNNLDPTLRSIASPAEFKTAIDRQLTHCNPLFYIGDRRITVILAQLRMNCSELRAHLFDLNIIKESHCQCGSPREDTVHFLIVCPLYTRPRILLHNTVSALTGFTVHNLLYGDQNLDHVENIEIYNAVITFVKESKRFNNA